MIFRNQYFKINKQNIRMNFSQIKYVSMTIKYELHAMGYSANLSNIPNYFLWLSMTMIEFRFCLRDISNVWNISCRAAFVGVFRRLRRKVTVPSRSSAIKASIPVVVKQTMFKEWLLFFFSVRTRTPKYKAIA